MSTSSNRCRRRKTRSSFRLESLEARRLPAGSPVSASIVKLAEVEPNDTLDVSQALGDLSALTGVEVTGQVGDGQGGASDVDWYRFTIDGASRVSLKAATTTGRSGFESVLSLYNDDPGDSGDPYDPIGHRLLEQATATPSGATSIDRLLGAGTYYLAISGDGNRDFHPLIASSGLPGRTGAYDLKITSTSAGLSAGDGPTVLASDPSDGASLVRSPLALRVDLSGPVDPSTVVAGQTVRLLTNPLGRFGDGNDQDVLLSSVNYSASIGELQLFPSDPLAPGTYRIVLSGDASSGLPTIADADGTPLGKGSKSPQGRDQAVTFRVGASATGQDLGTIPFASPIRVEGAIGVDPSFRPTLSADPSNPDPEFNPANQVNVYRFHVGGTGPSALLAEVFAGRIGSPLTPGLSLYRVGPDGQTLQFVDGNLSSYNNTQATDGSQPLQSDPVLTSPLTPGDYALVVADSFNTPSPQEGNVPGTPGLLDPNQPHGAQNGNSTGPYVLELSIQPTPEAPKVVKSSPSDGQTLDRAPTQLSVQFSEPVNVRSLAFQTFQQSSQRTVSSIYVQSADGTRFFPRFVSFGSRTNQATFQMLDGLAPGDYTLHLSGKAGLTDLGGNPLAGNDPSGDEVIHFRVAGTDRGIKGDPTAGFTGNFAPLPAGRVDLGVIFPDEWQAGLTLKPADVPGSSTTSTSGSSRVDQYRFTVLQDQTYFIALAGAHLPAGLQIALTDDQGNPVGSASTGGGQVLSASLVAGTYRISVTGFGVADALSTGYAFRLALLGSFDNPPPLLDGPSPALAFQIIDDPAPAAPSPAPPTSPTAPNSGGGSDSPGGSTPSTPISTTTGSPSGQVVAGQPSVTPPAGNPSGATLAGAGGSGFQVGPVGAASSHPEASGSSVALLPHDGSIAPSTVAHPNDLIVFGIGPVGGAHGDGGPSSLAASPQFAMQTPARGIDNLIAILAMSVSGQASPFARAYARDAEIPEAPSSEVDEPRVLAPVSGPIEVADELSTRSECPGDPLETPTEQVAESRPMIPDGDGPVPPAPAGISLAATVPADRPAEEGRTRGFAARMAFLAFGAAIAAASCWYGQIRGQATPRARLGTSVASKGSHSPRRRGPDSRAGGTRMSTATAEPVALLS
jgi:methionine-rich copper-binding protein CopC